MYLKIEINGEEKFYSFEKNQVTIGRSPKSDIQILTEGISRNHLTIYEEGGELFIEDMGSTNGSFINDDRLEPGKRVTFNSFFPVKLGFHVFLNLLDEVSPAELEKMVVNDEKSVGAGVSSQESTGKTKTKISPEKVYVPKSLGKVDITNPELLISKKRPGKTSEKNNKTKNKKEKNNLPKIIFVVAMLAVAGYLYKDILFGEEETVTAQVPAYKKVQPVVEKSPPVEESNSKKQVVVDLSQIKNKITYDKCLGDFELLLCKKLKEVREKDYLEGFAKIADNLYFAVNRDNLDESYSDLKYSEKEQADLVKMASHVGGRDFNYKEFVGQKKYIVKELEANELMTKAAAYTDIVLGKIINSILQNKEISKLIVVVYGNSNNPEYLSHVTLLRSELEALLKDEHIPFYLKAYWRSGIDSYLERHLNIYYLRRN